jgi:hypothetical protein
VQSAVSRMVGSRGHRDTRSSAANETSPMAAERTLAA